MSIKQKQTKFNNMRHCIYCGTEIADGNIFCKHCGRPIFDPQVNTEQKPETNKESDSPLEESESKTVSVEEPVQSEEYTAETAKTPDYEPENDTNVKQSGKNSKLTIVLCSIAAVLVIILVVMLVVKNSKPKYRIVNKAQTTQSAPKPSVEKKDTQSKNNDLAKKKDAASVGEELVYSIADEGYVNIRDFPNADSDVVGVLATNRDGAKLISNQGAWWKVRIDSVVGYVNSEYVRLSNTPVKINGLPNVYYVVLGSYESLDSALTYNYRRPDGMECWIYKCTAKGKTVYRLCDGCFSTLQKAQSAINDWSSSSLYGHWFTDAWIWKNDGLGNCVFCPVNYETERTKPPLTPE